VDEGKKMKNKKLTDLAIDKIEQKDSFLHPQPYHPVLPAHEFSMLIVAPKGSGKTNFLVNLITKHYKEYFHRIIVCSPTINNDEKWDYVKEHKHILKENKKLEATLNNLKRSNKIKKVVFTSEKPLEQQLKEVDEKFDGYIPEEDFFSELDKVPEKVAEQQEVIEKLHKLGMGKKSKFIADRMLVVLDDQAGMFKGGNTNNPMMNFVIKHRHSSSSVILVTQGYKAIPKTIRTNCNALILFDIPNLSELKAIYEENPTDMSEQEWMRIYRHATQEPFAFLYINTKFNKGQRVYKNFDTMLTYSTTAGRNDESSDDDDDNDKDNVEPCETTVSINQSKQ
jgi:O6-methylguanine-DNA--protein-cysteine methyltransferase